MTLFNRKAGRRAPITLDVRPVLQEELSATEFLKLVQTNPAIIKSSSPIMPVAGRPGFGAFQVTYVHPRYKVAL